MKVISMKIIAALCFLLSAPLYAGTAVIVNANNNSGIDIDTVKKIYLGKVKAFPDGSRAIPLTFEQGNNTRNAFNNNVLGKSESQYSAFWSKRPKMKCLTLLLLTQIPSALLTKVKWTVTSK